MKQRFFEIAKVASKNSDHHTHKLGAVVVDKSKVISVGYNKLKTSPKSPQKWGQVHAEMDAIFKSKADLSKCSIYVYRETKDGIPAESKPCPACMEVIRAAGISKIYYCTRDGYKKEVL